MQATFSDLGIALENKGYCRVLFVETYCPTHGGWRCAVVESASMISCPQCGLPHQAERIGYGFTRKPNAWEQWEKPLQAATRAALIVEEDAEAVAARQRIKLNRGDARHYNKRGCRAQCAAV
jgi:hypothetical protein